MKGRGVKEDGEKWLTAACKRHPNKMHSAQPDCDFPRKAANAEFQTVRGKSEWLLYRIIIIIIMAILTDPVDASDVTWFT